MSELVTLPNGEEAEVIESRSLAGRTIANDSNIELKGGEGPALYFNKYASIQPVYIVGALPNVLAADSPTPVVPRTTVSDIKTVAGISTQYGTTLTVPDGADKILVGFAMSAFTAAAGQSRVWWEASDDGVNWTISDDNDYSTFTPSATVNGASSWKSATNTTANSPGRRGLPKYVRAVLNCGDAGSSYEGRLWVTVS